MSDYDFRTLNDKEFELLCADVLGSMRGVRFERFKPGRDGGVDGRYFGPGETEEILQCKHWPSSPIEKLVYQLQTVELHKLNRLRPQRYWLAVSHALSRTDKANIQRALAPHVKEASDILGREDLNDILSKHKDIERRHYKLWLSTTNVLQHLLNKAVHDRSAFVGEEIAHNARLYVATENHNLALEKLERTGTVIITGEAGVGKTTLADQLVLGCLFDGFALVAIADEMKEAESVYEQDAKQVFYFDDFLGRNYLEALRGHESSQIVQFIRRVQRDKAKRFILTSRTTILNQGKALSDNFQIGNLQRAEFEIKIESLSELDRARILYNHIWHSGLLTDYVDVLYEGKRYRKIIAHQNFNPRLIRFVTDVDRLQDCSPAEYWRHVESTLANPVDVWDNPFSAQLDDFGRGATLLVALHGRAIADEELAEAYARFVSRPENSSLQGKRDFLTTLRHLSGSMLDRISVGSGATYFNLFNPSVGDYVLRRYSRDVPALTIAFLSLRARSSVGTVVNLHSNGFVSKETAAALLLRIVDEAIQLRFVGYSSEYIAEVCMALRQLDELQDASESRLREIINFVVSSDCPNHIAPASQIVRFALDHGLIEADAAAEFVRDACTQSPNDLELVLLAGIIRDRPAPIVAHAAKALAKATTDYLVDAVHDEFYDGDVFDGVEFEDHYAAEQNLRALIENKLSELKIELDDLDEIVDAYDIPTRHNSYFEREPEYEREGNRASVVAPSTDAIDDLFQRSS